MSYFCPSLSGLIGVQGLVLAACSSSPEAPSETAPPSIDSSAVHVRVNQIGYHPDDAKVAVAFSHRPVEGTFSLVDAETGERVYEGTLQPSSVDEFAPFQTDYVVYHDDIDDYSTNEPTMDGTAGAIYMMAHFGTSSR